MDPIFLVCLKESCDTLLKKRLLFPKFLHIWCSTNCTGLKDNLAISITLGRHKHGVKARHQTAANWLPWITSKGVSQTKSLDPACSSGGHLKSFWEQKNPLFCITELHLYIYFLDASYVLYLLGALAPLASQRKLPTWGEEMQCIVLYSPFYSPQQILSFHVFHNGVQTYLRLLIPVLTSSW